MTAEIRVLGPGDIDLLLHVAPEVFDNPPEEALSREFLADPRHHIVVAIDGGLVVAFASAIHYVHPDKPAQLWINEVAVAPTFRRLGLATAILRTLLQVGRAHHCTVAWVLTDRSNAAAMALYASIGGTEGADEQGPRSETLGYTFDLTRTGEDQWLPLTAFVKPSDHLKR
jgi:ribosomal protein S18 acetylase RimI-like enzyme